MNIWWAIFYLVASYLISASMQPKQQNARPTAFEDIDFPQADEGTPQCVVFGDCWITDWTVLAVGNYRVQAITTEGGKK
jgi:hypothetical protein